MKGDRLESERDLVDVEGNKGSVEGGSNNGRGCWCGVEVIVFGILDLSVGASAALELEGVGVAEVDHIIVSCDGADIDVSTIVVRNVLSC